MFDHLFAHHVSLQLAAFGVTFYTVTFWDKVVAAKEALERVLREAGLTLDQAARWAECDPGQFYRERQFGGVVGRILGLPRPVAVRYLMELSRIVGEPLMPVAEADEIARFRRFQEFLARDAENGRSGVAKKAAYVGPDRRAGGGVDRRRG